MQSKFSQLRQKAGYSLEQVAEHFGYSLRTIYRWENGDNTPKPLVFKELERMYKSSETSFQHNEEFFTFIDLFAGIGGLRKGFEHIGGKCVFTSEWNKFSRQTYAANFELDHEIAGDITQIDERSIPDHDVLLAGFPCQPFSIAGVSKKNALGRAHGFADETQGTLFFDIVRILKEKKTFFYFIRECKKLSQS